MFHIRSIVFLTLLSFFASAANNASLTTHRRHPESTLDCPFETECICEDSDGGHTIWCPNKIRSVVNFHYKPGSFFIVCNTAIVNDITDLYIEARKLNVGPVDSLVYQFCPIPQDSFEPLMTLLNITGIKAMRVDYGTLQSDGRLPRSLFSSLTELTDLDLRNTNARVPNYEVDPDVFGGISQLKYLSIMGNSITEIPEGLLQPLTNLETFHFLEKLVTSLPDNLFQNLPNLKEINIKGSNIRRLQHQILSPLSSLTSLTLTSFKFNLDIPDRDGNFESDLGLEPGIFDNLTNLVNFTFGGSGLDLMPDNLFMNNRKLDRLDFTSISCSSNASSCVLRFPNFVQNLTSLKVFRVSRRAGHVTIEFPDDFFLGCSSLEELTISYVKVQNFSASFLRSTTKLHRVDLSYNSLETLDENFFTSAKSLDYISLKNNNLKEIGLHFKSLTKLVYLDLSQNKILKLKPNAFNTNAKLEFLNMSSNALSFESQPNWDHMTLLETLDLSKNNISFSEIPYQWRTLYVNLRSLNLSRNSIGPSLSPNDFDFRHNEIRVDLSFNNIRRIRFEELSKPQSFSTSVGNLEYAKRPSIEVSNNPMDCDCQAHQLSQVIQWKRPPSLGRLKFIIKGDNLSCATPERLRGQLLKTLNLNDLTCAFPSPEIPEASCPDQCTCTYRPESPTSAFMDCSEKSLTKLPEPVPKVRDAVEVYINVSHNNLTSLSGMRSLVGNYTRAVILDMSHNQIENFTLVELPELFSRLYLDHNALEKVDEDVLRVLAKMDELRLGHNPFTCSCDLHDLYEFVNANARLITDVDEISIRCDDVTNIPLGTISDESFFCAQNLSFGLTASLILGILAFILFVSLAFVVLFRKRILIILYSRPYIRKLFPVEVEEENLTYDAFISYTEADSSFVVSKLLPGLEECEEIRYKCIEHTRDFIVGRTISEQIIEAIDNSRRTVIVLSKNYVNSTWAKHEFEIAHARKKVILVVLGELPSYEEMGTVLSDYIKSNTYLQHDDPWFWQKLRYALPHRGGWRSRRRFLGGFLGSLHTANGVRGSLKSLRRRHDTDQMQLVNGVHLNGDNSTGSTSNFVTVVNANGVIERERMDGGTSPSPPPTPANGFSYRNGKTPVGIINGAVTTCEAVPLEAVVGSA